MPKVGRLIVLFFLILSLIIPSSLAASLHGKVFDYNFRIANFSVVQINTVPEQLMVATDGKYSFNVPEGNYVISAFLKDSLNRTIYSLKDNISIVDEGDYVLDLIMFPQEDLDELDLENDINTDIDGDSKDQAQKIILIAVGLILIILFAWLYCVAFKKCKKEGKKEKKEESKEGNVQVKTANEEADDLADLLGFIRKNKRVTQKDIRRNFPLSEAKISLILTDLESQGKIRKIKKGRGNIIIYNEKQ